MKNINLEKEKLISYQILQFSKDRDETRKLIVTNLSDFNKDNDETRKLGSSPLHAVMPLFEIEIKNVRNTNKNLTILVMKRRGKECRSIKQPDLESAPSSRP